MHVVKASFEQTRQQSEDLAKELTLQLKEAVNDIQKTGDTLVNDLRDEIDGLKKGEVHGVFLCRARCDYLERRVY